MRKILAAAGLLLFINCIWILFRSGVSNTFLLSLGLFAGTCTYAAFYDRLRKIKWLNCAIFGAGIIAAVFGIFVMAYGRKDTATFQEDAAIVLGAGLRDGEPSRMLRNRLDMAVKYHFQNPEAVIIVSGGIGHGQVVSEAYIMARYLQAAGVPWELIVQEDGSHSTFQNMVLSLEILEELFPEGFQAVVITNDFHIYRAVRFTRIVGMENATGLHGNTPVFSLPGALVREIAAIVKMWLVGT